MDGSFGADGDAGAGTIVRDHMGDIVVYACCYLANCIDACDAELSAAREGPVLALDWCTQLLILEMDCLEIVKLLQNKNMDPSVYTFMIEEVKSSSKDRQTCIIHVKRAQNIISHLLANFARINDRTSRGGAP
jgi:hypothetical protein